MSTLAELTQHAGLPRLEAQLLLDAAGGGNRVTQLTWPEREASTEVSAHFAQLCERRLAGEPMAYLLGEREFFGLDLQVSPAVLIPRPDTETLVEQALLRLPASARVLDLGTGSGAVALALAHARPDAEVWALDVSAPALAQAEANGQRLGLQVTWRLSDWFAAVAGERFALLVSNPPYIAADDPHLQQGDLRFEPAGALTDFADGLSAIRQLAAGAPAHLLPGGWLLIEHGWQQADAVQAILRQTGFAEVASWQDLAGHQRVSGGRWPPSSEQTQVAAA